MSPILDTFFCPSSEGKHGAETAQSDQEIWIELKGSAIGRDGLVMVPKTLTQNTPSIQCENSSASSSRIGFWTDCKLGLKHFPRVAGKAHQRQMICRSSKKLMTLCK